MRIVDVEQGSAEWLDLRAGKVTASRVADVMARTKTGWGASRKNYAAQLITERLTGKPADTFQNDAMHWGTETEPEARSMYAFELDVDVVQVGAFLHPERDDCMASPDGLVGEDGLVEIKCPNTATHIDTLLAEQIPRKYALQMQWQMICANRDWCDFVSYDPRLPGEMSLYIHRMNYDFELADALELEVFTFLEEINQTVDELRSRYPSTEKIAA